MNKMLVMAKDLSSINNIIDVMQINTILNKLPQSWKITIIELKNQFGNLNINKLSLQLKDVEEDIKIDKNHKLILVQDKPLGS